ncbi:MAG: hypothetical protein J6Q22_10755 [Prevotella sp.]|nr:hypothetical protein [Prevotella sp.]
MNISKIKAAYALLTGGVAGIIKYFLGIFNTQILGKIPNKEASVKYLLDVRAAHTFIGAILANHSEDISEGRKSVLLSILAAIDELAKAIEDFEVDETEFDEIIQKVKKAIDAWKKARK